MTWPLNELRRFRQVWEIQSICFLTLEVGIMTIYPVRENTLGNKHSVQGLVGNSVLWVGPTQSSGAEVRGYAISTWNISLHVGKKCRLPGGSQQGLVFHPSESRKKSSVNKREAMNAGVPPLCSSQTSCVSTPLTITAMLWSRSYSYIILLLFVSVFNSFISLR